MGSSLGIWGCRIPRLILRRQSPSCPSRRLSAGPRAGPSSLSDTVYDDCTFAPGKPGPSAPALCPAFLPSTPVPHPPLHLPTQRPPSRPSVKAELGEASCTPSRNLCSAAQCVLGARLNRHYSCHVCDSLPLGAGSVFLYPGCTPSWCPSKTPPGPSRVPAIPLTCL